MGREPGDYYRNNNLRLPASIPNTTSLTMGNVHPFIVTVRMEREYTHVNDTDLVAGARGVFAYDYPWRRGDGQVLQVHETLDVHYLGDWIEPFRTEEAHMCI